MLHFVLNDFVLLSVDITSYPLLENTLLYPSGLFTRDLEHVSRRVISCSCPVLFEDS